MMIRVEWHTGKELIDAATGTRAEVVEIVRRWLDTRTPMAGERIVFQPA